MLNTAQIEALMARNPGLSKQSYEDIPKMHALSPEVISRQATINIGTIGHVSHGKSTLVEAISGVHTVRFHNEKIRNITIKLGYANAKIYKCPKCPGPDCYRSFSSHTSDILSCPNKNCNDTLKLVRHVSFVDCPGHDIFMATMLTGAAVMDAALLIVAGNMSCPQPQTSEHLAAVDIMQLNHIIIVQNKIDIIFRDETAAKKNYAEIKKFIAGTRAEKSPIIPISAQLRYNIDAVCQYIAEYIPVPLRDFSSSPRLIVIRSFDVNKPGEEVENLKGGVAGGSIIRGVLKVGDEIEIRPGIIVKDAQGQAKCSPIYSRVISLLTESNDLLYAVPGGLIGVGLKVDPTLTRGDRLVGHVLGLPGQLPDIYYKLKVKFFLLRRLVGVKSEAGSSKSDKVRKIVEGETLMINVGSTSTGGKIMSINNNLLKISLVGPVCTQVGEKAALSRRIDKKWRLIGWGVITEGITAEKKEKNK